MSFFSMVAAHILLHVIIMVAFIGLSYGHVRRLCREPKLPKITSQVHESFLMMEEHYEPTVDVQAFVNIRRTPISGSDGSDQCSWQSQSKYNSSCPYHYVINNDPNRRPQSLLEVKCNCNENSPCLNGGEGSRCVPVRYFINVWRKTGCDGVHFTYTRTVEQITVGCTCIYPKSNHS